MRDYQRILLAVDLSEHSASVAARAAQLAKALNAHVDLLHVLEHALVHYAADVVPPESLDKFDIIRARVRENLTELAQRFNLTNFNLFIETGAIKDEIVRVAEEQHADLLVIGSHERHGLALLRGSLTDRVLHGAHCDVLAVHLPS